MLKKTPEIAMESEEKKRKEKRIIKQITSESSLKGQMFRIRVFLVWTHDAKTQLSREGCCAVMRKVERRSRGQPAARSSWM